MASRFYNAALTAIQDGTIDLNTDDIRAKLLMTNTTAGTQNDGVVHVSDITTLDVCDASGYADCDMDGLAVNTVDASDRSSFDAHDAAFSGLGGNASRNYRGVLIYKRVTGVPSADLAIAFIQFTADVVRGSTLVTAPWHADGLWYISQAA